MRPAVMLNPEPLPAVDGFTKTPTPAHKASRSAKKKKPIPFKVRWLNQIAGDGTLPALAVRTAILLADDYDDEKGYAWPSQLGLAARLNASRAGVRLAIKRLDDAGYLEYVAQRGRKKNNRYFLRCPEHKNGY